MPERAQVSSVEAIAEFRSKLIVFATKARSAVEEAGDEIRRTQAWLENDQRSHWEGELRRRSRALDEAEQELLNARMSRIQTQSAAQVLAVERARRAVREAEEKRAEVRKWIRDFGNRADPLGKQVEQLLWFLGTDLSKAVAYLGNVIAILDAYAAAGSEGGREPSVPPLPVEGAEGAGNAANPTTPNTSQELPQ